MSNQHNPFQVQAHTVSSTKHTAASRVQAPLQRSSLQSPRGSSSSSVAAASCPSAVSSRKWHWCHCLDHGPYHSESCLHLLSTISDELAEAHEGEFSEVLESELAECRDTVQQEDVEAETPPTSPPCSATMPSRKRTALGSLRRDHHTLDTNGSAPRQESEDERM